MIRGYGADIALEKLGNYVVRLLRSDHQQSSAATTSASSKKRLSRHREIVEWYNVSGGYDYLLKIVTTECCPFSGTDGAPAAGRHRDREVHEPHRLAPVIRQARPIRFISSRRSRPGLMARRGAKPPASGSHRPRARGIHPASADDVRTSTAPGSCTFAASPGRPTGAHRTRQYSSSRRLSTSTMNFRRLDPQMAAMSSFEPSTRRDSRNGVGSTEGVSFTTRSAAR